MCERMDMSSDSKEIIRRLGIGTAIRHEKTEKSSVTTLWGVEWDETMIARDIMQNFYDANRTLVDAITVSGTDGTVEIAAPAIFNLDRLLYLGSEKGPDEVGQYGEGFKAAAICLLRDHHVTPVAWSGNRILSLRIADKPAEGTELYPVMYDFYVTETSANGTRLFLLHCPKKLTAELHKGLLHFLYPNNPLLGKKLWPQHENDFAIYESTDGVGHVFYRSLKRGEIPGVPVVLIIDKEYKSIESKIAKDRDRKAFGGDLLELFYRRFVRGGLNYSREGKRILVESARPHWIHGHSLLSEIADSAGYRPNVVFPPETVESIFGNEYFAKSYKSRDGIELRYSQVERDWVAEGRQALPAYFARMGLISAEEYCRKLDEKAKKESLEHDVRPPSPSESECIEVLRNVMKDFAPEILAVFNKRRTTYMVADTETFLGELRKANSYNSKEIFLAASVFVAKLPEAVAIFLHEHSHIFGYDGTRGFTDALTRLLATVISQRKSIDDYEALWETARKNVIAERKKTRWTRKDSDFGERVAQMSESDLRKLVGLVPPLLLKGLLDDKEE